MEIVVDTMALIDWGLFLQQTLAKALFACNPRRGSPTLYLGREGFVTMMVKVLKIISRLVTSKNNSIYGIYIEKYLL